MEEIIPEEIIPKSVSAFMMGAWGDRIAFTYLFRQLKGVTPDMLSGLVKDNKPLFAEVPETEWPKYRELVEKYSLSICITRERFATEFQARRSDLAKVVLDEPNGPAWFNSQVTTIRVKLGLEQPAVRWKKTNPSPPS